MAWNTGVESERRSEGGEEEEKEGGRNLMRTRGG